jgi:hypothetical protein
VKSVRRGGLEPSATNSAQVSRNGNLFYSSNFPAKNNWRQMKFRNIYSTAAHGKTINCRKFFPLIQYISQIIYRIGIKKKKLYIKGIVSRDLHICFLVSIDRSEIPTHTKRVRLLLKFRFRVEFFDFRGSA